MTVIVSFKKGYKFPATQNLLTNPNFALIDCSFFASCQFVASWSTNLSRIIFNIKINKKKSNLAVCLSLVSHISKVKLMHLPVFVVSACQQHLLQLFRSLLLYIYWLITLLSDNVKYLL